MKRILVTGATGFLGKSVCKKLETNRGVALFKTSLSSGVDLRNREATFGLFQEIRPDAVINCAAFVGGIQFGYKFPAEIFHNNLAMTLNLLEACKTFKIGRLVNPISNCAYPSKATFFKEAEFWDGPLHESVLTYGFVRKASWVGSWAYARQHQLDVINLILSNMFGPEDHFQPERSHALGALIHKFVEAKEERKPHVEVWGSGSPVREWLYVEDGAEALIRGLDIPAHSDPINIGVGKGISILELAQFIKKAVGYEGEIKLDPSKPDGAPYKTVDGTLGRRIFEWSPEADFQKAICETIDWYLSHRTAFSKSN